MISDMHKNIVSMILREKDLLIQEHTARIFCFNISTSFLICNIFPHDATDCSALRVPPGIYII